MDRWSFEGWEGGEGGEGAEERRGDERARVWRSLEGMDEVCMSILEYSAIPPLCGAPHATFAK